MDAGGSYSSAYDMAMLARYAMRNPSFREMASTRFRNHDLYPMYNLNRLLDVYPAADGVKIGYTDAAQKTIVASAVHNGRRVCVSLLHSANLVSDSSALFEWVWDNFEWQIAVQVTFDCANPSWLAEFWATALGYVIQPPPTGFDSWEAWLEAQHIPRELWDSMSAAIDPDGRGPRLLFQKVPEGKTAKNRVHLDVNVGGESGTPMRSDVPKSTQPFSASSPQAPLRSAPRRNAASTGSSCTTPRATSSACSKRPL